MSHGSDPGHGFSSVPGGGTDEGGVGGVLPSVSSPPKSYALSGKIMLSAIVILFTVVLLILCLHVYARWYLLRRARLRRRTRRRLVFTAENQAAAASRGLDPEVIKALPVFTYSAAKCAAGSDESMECAVCLSEFQEDDKGRRLPGCKHSFHIECIDMWFYSHDTCPLCRSTVEPESPLPVSESVHIQIEAPASPGLCDSCRREDHAAATASASATGGSSSSFSSSSAASSCSSSNSPGCGALNRIDVPPRRGVEGLRSLEEEVGSPGGAQGFKSPGSRMGSLKRILSFDLRFYRGGCSSNDPDLERGPGAAEERTPCAPAPAPPPQQR